MALIYDGKLFLSLQEQVEKNKDDIEKILYTEGILSDYGIRVVGQVADANDLPDPEQYLQAGGLYGEAFAVGESEPYSFYIFTRPFEGEIKPQWFAVGQLAIPGPKGEDGADGPEGPAGPASVWLSGTTVPSDSIGTHVGDMYLNTSNGNVYEFNGTSWALTGNIRGPQGLAGSQGQQGIQGETGPTGPKGDPGIPAFAITLKAELQSTAELPVPPTEEMRHDGYIIQDELWVILEDEDGALQWSTVGYGDPGSRITVNGIWQPNYEMNNKVSVSTAPYQVYATNGTAAQTLITYSQNNDANTMVQRNISGQILASDPTQDRHVATRGYIRGNFLAKDTTLSAIYGTNASGINTMLSYSNIPGNGNIPQYNANGNLKAASPVADNDVVNKSYFIANNTKFTITTNPNGSYNLILSKGI